MHAQAWRLSCDPMDHRPPGSSVCGIFQARILELVAISSFRGPSWPRDWTWVSCVSCTGRWILYHCPAWEAPKATLVKVTQSCPTLCHPKGCTVHGILQARILEWVAIPFSRDLPNPAIEPRSSPLQADSLLSELVVLSSLSHLSSLVWTENSEPPDFSGFGNFKLDNSCIVTKGLGLSIVLHQK